MTQRYTCPECGADFWVAGSGRAASWRPVASRFAESVGPGGLAAGDIDSYESVQPAAAPEVAGHFLTPFLQAMATGLSFFVLAAVAAIVWLLPIWLPFVVGALAFALAWLVLLGRFNALLVAREFVKARPSQGMVASLKDERPAPRLVVEVSDHQAGQSVTQIAELPVDIDRLGTLARAVAGGQELTYSRWAGRGKLLTRGELGELQEWMVRCGLAAWKNPGRHQEGLEFSAGGRRFWSRLAAGEYDVI